MDVMALAPLLAVDVVATDEVVMAVEDCVVFDEVADEVEVALVVVFVFVFDFVHELVHEDEAEVWVAEAEFVLTTTLASAMMLAIRLEASAGASVLVDGAREVVTVPELIGMNWVTVTVAAATDDDLLWCLFLEDDLVVELLELLEALVDRVILVVPQAFIRDSAFAELVHVKFYDGKRGQYAFVFDGDKDAPCQTLSKTARQSTID